MYLMDKFADNPHRFAALGAFLVLFLTVPLSFLIVFMILGNNVSQSGAETTCSTATVPEFGKLPDEERGKKVAEELGLKTNEIRQNKDKLVKNKQSFSANKADLITKLNDRKQRLAESMVRNPDRALVELIDPDDSKDMAAQTSNCLETQFEATGTLKASHADFFKEAKSDYLTILKTEDGKTIRLNFARGSHIPIESGERVRVKGIRLDDELLLDGGSPVKNSGFAGGIDFISGPGNPPIADFQGTVGVIVQFQDTPTPLVGPTNDQIKNVLNNLESYYNKNSYGRVTLGKAVIGPITLDIPSTCDYVTVGDKTVRALESQVDFNVNQRLMIYAAFPNGCWIQGISQDIGKSIVAGHNISVGYINWSIGPSDYATFHEYGHGLGMRHAGGIQCFDKPLGQNCYSNQYGDYIDIMGGSWNNLELNLKHRQILGFVTDSQVQKVTNAGTYTIGGMEVAGGIKGLVIPRNEAENIYVEMRTPYEFDYGYSPPERYYNGAVISIDGDGLYTNTNLVMKPQGGGVFAPGEYFIDPQSGVKVTVISVSGAIQFAQLTVKVEFGVGVSSCVNCTGPSSNVTNMQVVWPDKNTTTSGYLSAVSRIKNVSWADQTYVVSLRCTSNFFGCPQDLGDKLTTTATNGKITMASGFSYDYSVDIYTKQDGNINSTARYFWAKTSTGVISCPSPQTTCAVDVSWPAVTYKTTLLVAGTDNKACVGAQGCQDYIALSSASATFRGLLAIDGATQLDAKIEVSDFNGGTHILQKVTGLGKPDDFIKSCTGLGGCKIGNPAGIGPFIGGELILYSVKVGDQNGLLIKGPSTDYTALDGSYSMLWTIPGIKYSALIYKEAAGSCLNAGSECQTEIEINGNSWVFGNLTPGVTYHETACYPDCGTGAIILNTTKVAPTPIPAKLNIPLLNCLSSNSVNVYFSWMPASGVVIDSQYFDISPDWTFKSGTLGIKFSNDDLVMTTHYNALDLAGGNTYYFRVNTLLRGGGWVTSSVQSVTTACATASLQHCTNTSVGSNQLTGCLYQNTDATGGSFTGGSDNAPSGAVLTSPVADNVDGININPFPVNSFIGNDDFSTRWKGDFTFKPGVYTFHVNADDGARVFIGSLGSIDAWAGGCCRDMTTIVTFSSQQIQTITLEQFENSGGDGIHFWWTYAPVPTVPWPRGCQADFNVDGNINSIDQLIYAKNSPPTTYIYNSKYDLNDDGKLNVIEQLIIAKLAQAHTKCAIPTPPPPTVPPCVSGNFGSALNFYWLWSGLGVQSYDIRISDSPTYSGANAGTAGKNLTETSTTGASGWSGTLSSGGVLFLKPNTVYYWSVRVNALGGYSNYSYSLKIPAVLPC
jgi:hypothetical protein